MDDNDFFVRGLLSKETTRTVTFQQPILSMSVVLDRITLARTSIRLIVHAQVIKR